MRKREELNPARINSFSRAKSPDLTLATVVNCFIAQLESEYGWPVLSVVICLFSFPPVFAIFFNPLWRKKKHYIIWVLSSFLRSRFKSWTRIFSTSGKYIRARVVKEKGRWLMLQVRSSKNEIDTDGGNLENDREWSLQVYCYVDTLHNTTSLFFIKR